MAAQPLKFNARRMIRCAVANRWTLFGVSNYAASAVAAAYNFTTHPDNGAPGAAVFLVGLAAGSAALMRTGFNETTERHYASALKRFTEGRPYNRSEYEQKPYCAQKGIRLAMRDEGYEDLIRTGAFCVAQNTQLEDRLKE